MEKTTERLLEVLKKGRLYFYSMKELLTNKPQILEMAFNQSLSAIAILDREFNFILVNEAYARADNRKVSEFPGRNHFDFYPSDAKAIFEQVVQTKEPYQVFARPFVYEYNQKRGVTYWDWTLSPALDNDGEVEFLIFSLSNVTDKINNELQLKRLFEISHDIICISDFEGCVRSVNPAFRNILGYEKKDVLGKNLFDFVHAEDLEPTKATHVNAIPSASPVKNFKNRYRCKDGSYKWLEWSSVPVSQEGLTYSVVRDVTEKIIADEKLSNARQQIANILESITDAFYAVDNDWNITYVNETSAEIMGKTQAELIGENLWDTFPNYNPFTYEKFHKVMKERIPDHFEVFASSVNLWTKVHAYPSKDGLAVFYRDITTRKENEKKLLESEMRFRSLFENSVDGILLTKPDGSVLAANSAICNLLGRTEKELCNLESCSIVDLTDPRIPQALKERKIKGKVKSELNVIHKDGTIIPVEFASQLFPGADGETLTCVMVRDARERIKTQQEMNRLERLNLVGQMAAGISHEIRNPMTSVRGFLQILRGKAECQDYKDYFNLMINELDRANSIIAGFLSLAKNKKNHTLEKQNLNTVLEKLLPLITADAMKLDIFVNTKFGNIPDMLLNEEEIRQLILNLTRNGFEAMSPGQTLTIKTSMERQDVILSVQDQGVGMSSEVLENIGTPFFTTKADGTGLGMAVCHSIAEQHNAKIDIETGSSGTTFFVWFKLGSVG
ncbi:MAG: PAS domain S-box protein [Firmicutes bacterium]|nr:PAS domain S-box protein [Bacillota bacterium]